MNGRNLSSVNLPNRNVRVALCPVGTAVTGYMGWNRNACNPFWRAAHYGSAIREEAPRLCPGRGAAFFTLLRRAGTVPTPACVTAPALQRTASQVLRAALRPGNGV